MFFVKNGLVVLDLVCSFMNFSILLKLSLNCMISFPSPREDLFDVLNLISRQGQAPSFTLTLSVIIMATLICIYVCIFTVYE